MRVRWIIALAVLLLSLAGSCRSQAPPDELTKTCTDIGQRCLHSPGKMGICGAATDQLCASPPCLECVSQH